MRPGRWPRTPHAPSFTKAQRKIVADVGWSGNQVVAYYRFVKDGQGGLDDLLGAGQLKLAVVVDSEKVDVRSGHLLDFRGSVRDCLLPLERFATQRPRVKRPASPGTTRQGAHDLSPQT